MLHLQSRGRDGSVRLPIENGNQEYRMSPCFASNAFLISSTLEMSMVNLSVKVIPLWLFWAIWMTLNSPVLILGEPELVFGHHLWPPYLSAFHSPLPFGRVGEDRQRRLHECHGLAPHPLSHH